MKNILVLHYSQSGQLTEILDNLLLPINSNDQIKVTSHRIEMETPYPFPWSRADFFDAFPESFLQIPSKLKPISDEILNQQFDLIILGCQVWYLSPSIPLNSLLCLPEAKQLFNNTPVVTVIGCRNLWMSAQEKVKKQLKTLNAQLVGNVVLADRHINHISVITIVKWMFSGKKKRYLGVFPKPGVSEKDIKGAAVFGQQIMTHLIENKFQNLQAKLIESKAVVVKPFLVLIDKRANFLFSKWAKFVYSKGAPKSQTRKPWLELFNFYLLFAIWIVSPIVFILFLLSFLPLYGKIKKEKAYYSSVEIK